MTQHAARRVRAARVQARPDLFDAFWREVLVRVEEMVDARAATMGTVVGRDGGKVRVRLDDEDDDRVIGFGRALGVAYDNGDRVPVARTRAGDPLILGVVSGGNNDKRVRNEQLDSDAVDGRAIKQNAIGSGHLDGMLAKKISDAIDRATVENMLNPYLKSSDANQKFATQQALDKKASQEQVTQLERKVKELETKVARLSKSKGKGK